MSVIVYIPTATALSAAYICLYHNSAHDFFTFFHMMQWTQQTLYIRLFKFVSLFFTFLYSCCSSASPQKIISIIIHRNVSTFSLIFISPSFLSIFSTCRWLKLPWQILCSRASKPFTPLRQLFSNEFFLAVSCSLSPSYRCSWTHWWQLRYFEPTSLRN